MPLSAYCRKPIRLTESKVTIQGVVYHAACWERKTRQPATRARIPGPPRRYGLHFEVGVEGHELVAERAADHPLRDETIRPSAGPRHHLAMLRADRLPPARKVPLG
jgi:hypothetical protein